MTKIKWIIGLIIVSGLWSCNKNHLTDCFKNTGEKTTETRSLPWFNNVKLYDNINLVISQGHEASCVVETGKNLLSGITTTVDGQGNLEIRNTNTCNWVRSYDNPLTVYLQVKQLDTLVYRSIGDVYTIDTLFLDTLVINLYEGAGRVDLVVRANLVTAALHYGTQELVVSGRCGVAYVYSASFGLVDTRDLYASLMYVNNKSANDVYVRASEVLGATIEGLGNIYYYGDPPEVGFIKQGSGELIHLVP